MALLTHTPYAIPTPTTPAGAEPQKSGRFTAVWEVRGVIDPPRHWGRACLHEVPRLGWRVLQRLWHLTPDDFDAIALAHLSAQPGFVQQHVLLVLATTSVKAVKNLSAFLRSLIREVGERAPVCLGFIAGCCQRDTGCPFVHPTLAPGWQLLQDRWQLGWLDFDYLVLNSLLLKPPAKQDQVLRRLAGMKVRSVRNPSALLASIIQQCEGEADPRRPSLPPSATPTPSACSPPAGAHLSQRAPSLAASDDVASSEADTIGPSDSLDSTLDEGVLQSFASRCGSFAGVVDDPSAVGANPRPLPALPVPVLAPPAPTPAPPRSQPVSPPVRPGGGGSVPPALAPAPRPDAAPTVSRDSPAVPATLPPPPSVWQAASPDQPAPWRGTGHVVEALRQWAALPPPAAGWAVLRVLWGLEPGHFSPAALLLLSSRPPLAQEHALLSIAALDLRPPHMPPDPTALLRTALGTRGRPVCWRRLAGLCLDADCQFLHPPFVSTWNELRKQGVVPEDVDFVVLNALLQQPPTVQTAALTAVCLQPAAAAAGPSQSLLAALRQVLCHRA